MIKIFKCFASGAGVVNFPTICELNAGSLLRRLPILERRRAFVGETLLVNLGNVEVFPFNESIRTSFSDLVILM